MSSEIEVREKHKKLFGVLLKLKKANESTGVAGLQEEIRDQVSIMDKEDVSWVEKVYGVSAL